MRTDGGEHRRTIWNSRLVDGERLPMDAGVEELDVLIYPDQIRAATPEDLRQWELETAASRSWADPRLFVALYPYNPASMSPNPDTAAEELPFVPGQIIKVSGRCSFWGFF